MTAAVSFLLMPPADGRGWSEHPQIAAPAHPKVPPRRLRHPVPRPRIGQWRPRQEIPAIAWWSRFAAFPGRSRAPSRIVPTL